jgi:hypothetical protein
MKAKVITGLTTLVGVMVVGAVKNEAISNKISQLDIKGKVDRYRNKYSPNKNQDVHVKDNIISTEAPRNESV